MVSARAFSSLSFSECMAERLPCTRHTQVPLFPFIPTYPSYQKKSYYAKGFYCLPKALLRAGAGRAGAQKSYGGLCVPVLLLMDFSHDFLWLPWCIRRFCGKLMAKKESRLRACFLFL